MRIMEFDVKAVVGGQVVAHGRGNTLGQALTAFAKAQAENATEWVALANKATASITEAKT